MMMMIIPPGLGGRMLETEACSLRTDRQTRGNWIVEPPPIPHPHPAWGGGDSVRDVDEGQPLSLGWQRCTVCDNTCRHIISPTPTNPCLSFHGSQQRGSRKWLLGACLATKAPPRQKLKIPLWSLFRVEIPAYHVCLHWLGSIHGFAVQETG